MSQNIIKCAQNTQKHKKSKTGRTDGPSDRQSDLQSRVHATKNCEEILGEKKNEKTEQFLTDGWIDKYAVSRGGVGLVSTN